MSKGHEELASAYAKLDWARSRHQEMVQTFDSFVQRENPDDRPYGILFDTQRRPAGLVMAKFIIEEEMPTAMSMLAGDLVHSTRVALDYVVARLKAQFGGKPGQGGFPVCSTPEEWDEKVVNRGKNRPLKGLEETPAFTLVFDEQPLRRDDPKNDPLVILQRLDGDDKHHLLRAAFVYAGEIDGEAIRRGVDLIEVRDPKRVKAVNSWRYPQPLEHGTLLATFMVSGGADYRDLLGARQTPFAVGFAIGPLGEGRTGFTDMIDRVRAIVDRAAALVDG